MRTVLAFIFTTLLIVAMALGAVLILVRATLFVISLTSPLQSTLAIAAELLLGVILLLGTVWLATHLAVRIFSQNEPPSMGGPIV
jgi:hypothetical protein